MRRRNREGDKDKRRRNREGDKDKRGRVVFRERLKRINSFLGERKWFFKIPFLQAK